MSNCGALPPATWAVGQFNSMRPRRERLRMRARLSKGSATVNFMRNLRALSKSVEFHPCASAQGRDGKEDEGAVFDLSSEKKWAMGLAAEMERVYGATFCWNDNDEPATFLIVKGKSDLFDFVISSCAGSSETHCSDGEETRKRGESTEVASFMCHGAVLRKVRSPTGSAFWT